MGRRYKQGYQAAEQGEEQKSEESQKGDEENEEDKKLSTWQKYKQGLEYLYHHPYYMAICFAKPCGVLSWGAVEVVKITQFSCL